MGALLHTRGVVVGVDSVSAMRFSVWINAAQDWPTILRLAQHAEASGWDGIYIADHFMPPSPTAEGPTFEGLSLLAGLAAAVPRVRLGTLVIGNTYRHPAVLANQFATIDHISGGRVVLGIGAGWQQNEHDKYGIELPAPGPRLRRFEEALQIVRGLRDEERFSLAGEFYALDDAPMEPKPIGPMPILVGGSGERVMPGIVARWADEWNVWGDPEKFGHKSSVMSAACEAMGRDPGSLWRSTQALVFAGAKGAETAAKVNELQASIGGTPEQLREVVGAYQTAGLDELIVPDFNARSPEEAIDVWHQLLTEVAPEFR